MRVKIECMECNFEVKADLKKGCSLTPKELESMANWFGFEITSDGYICKECLEKKQKEDKNE